MEHELPVAGGILIVAIRELFAYLKVQREKDNNSKLERIIFQLDKLEKILDTKEYEMQQLKEDFVTAKISLARLLERGAK